MKQSYMLVFALLAWTGDAFAEAGVLQVEWSNPDCEAPERLEETVLSIAPLQDGAALSVRVEGVQQGSELTATVTSSAGVRHVRAGDCERLQEAVVVVLALMVTTARAAPVVTPPLIPVEQPGLPKETSSTNTVLPPTRTTTVARAPAAEPVKPATAETPRTSIENTARRSYSLGVGVSVRGNLGFMPRAALAPVLRLRYARSQVGVQIDLAYTPQVQSQGPEPAQSVYSAVGGGLEFDWFVVGNGLQGQAVVGLSAGAHLGVIRGRAEGITAPLAASGVTAAFLLGAEGRVPLGPVSLWLRVDGALQLLRPQFQVAGLGNLHQVSAFTGRTEIGVGYAFF